MSQKAISDALEGAVRAVPGMVALVEAGTPVTPPSGQPYASFDVLFNTPTVVTLGEEGYDRHTGFVQLTLRYPPGPNSKDQILTLADAIRESFKAGSRAYSGDQEVVIQNSGLGNFDVVSGRLVNPFTIYWYALTRR